MTFLKFVKIREFYTSLKLGEISRLWPCDEQKRGRSVDCRFKSYDYFNTLSLNLVHISLGIVSFKAYCRVVYSYGSLSLEPIRLCETWTRPAIAGKSLTQPDPTPSIYVLSFISSAFKSDFPCWLDKSTEKNNYYIYLLLHDFEGKNEKYFSSGLGNMFPDGDKDDLEGSYFSRPIQEPRNNQWKTKKLKVLTRPTKIRQNRDPTRGSIWTVNNSGLLYSICSMRYITTFLEHDIT